MDIKRMPVNGRNFRFGRTVGTNVYVPQAIVIHLMAGSLAGTDAWFNDPVSSVSAHYGTGKNGTIHQYVNEEDTAFHSGSVHQPTWTGLKPGVNPNAYLLGIENEGRLADIGQWPDAQHAACAWLIQRMSTRWSIPLDRAHVIGHHEINALHNCPGPNCDLDRLIAEARALGVGPTDSATREP